MIDAVRRFLHGRTDQREWVRFAVVMTVALLVVELVNYVLLSPRWWDHQVSLAVGVVILAAAVGGFRDHGLVHAAVPPYLFTVVVLTFGGAYSVRVGSEPPLTREAISYLLFPLVLCLPFVLIGYWVGFGLSLASEIGSESPTGTVE